MKQTHWNFLPADEQAIVQLQESLKIAPIFCQLLAQRGILDFETARSFFRPNLDDLHDPFLMQDMDKAVQRLDAAIEQGQRILLYGDYDVDGTTSVALMYAYLSSIHKNLDYYLPDREKDGYGVSLAAVEYARETACSLVIAMDCGIKAHAAITLANTYGIDFIVCDHHLPEDGLPPAFAILDPKRPDCAYPYKELSGCGVAFKLAQAFAQHNNVPAVEIDHLLDFVAISIGCDIVPITGENRILAHYGLERINRDPRVGVWAIVNRSSRSYPLIISDLVFGLGPLINAAGRVGDAREAVRLLLSADKQSALDNAAALVQHNRHRQTVDQSMAISARSRVTGHAGWEAQKSCVLYDPTWHKGIIGIVASRIAEEFHRPTVVLTLSEGRAVGSARSVAGFDLYGALQQCSELFLSFGGHAHAAGIQMLPENVEVFIEKFEQIVQHNMTLEAEGPILDISAELNFSQINSKFWKILKQFAPFGPHNLNPVFYAKNVFDTGKSRLLANDHVRFVMRQEGFGSTFTGMGFSMAKKFSELPPGKPFDIAFNIREENWRGEMLLSLQIKDVKGN